MHAQTPNIAFDMDVTYYCPGDAIVFHYSYTSGSSGIQQVNVNLLNQSGGVAWSHSCSLSGYTLNPTDPAYAYVSGTHSYTLTGYYNNVYHVYDTIVITVVDPMNVVVTPSSSTVGPGGTAMLHAEGADYYVWNACPNDSPYANLTVSNTDGGATAQVSVAADVPDDENCFQFCVTGYKHGDNRVNNGDFEQAGNCTTGYGFNSDYDCYDYANCLYPHEGAFSIGDNANYYHQDFNNPPNNAGHGKFMIINGDPTNNASGRVIWSQTIDVRPNIQYAFSADVCTFVDRNFARLQFSINGTMIGDVYTAHPKREGWQTFYAIWEGSPNNTATITLVNLQTAGDGNDFGVDNITFYDLMECSSIQTEVEVCIERDVTVGDITAPAAICAGGALVLPNYPTVQINSGSQNYSYSWQVAPSPTGPWQNMSNFNNMTSDYNGWYLRCIVTHDGTPYPSNSVRITIIPELDVHIVALTMSGDTITGPLELCEGDSVQLHAVAQSVDVYVAVGDILCTDGSIEKPSNWASAYAEGKRAKGVVFYVDDTKAHGWAVGLSQEEKAWSTKDETLTDNRLNWRDAIAELDGYAKTGNIRILTMADSLSYPAVWSVDFRNGWYLPAAGQLNLLFGELVPVNASLTLVGGTTIVDTGGATTTTGGNGKTCLWSTTEKKRSGSSYPYSAYVLEVMDGEIKAVDKKCPANLNLDCMVRPVINF